MPSLDSGAALEDFYDDRYGDGYMARHDALEVARVRDVLAEVPADATRVLDYGCGSGAWTAILAERFPEAEIVGVEISEKAVAQAREAHPEHRFLHFDGTRAPLPDETFDAVFSYHVLEHVWDLEASIADMARLVTPGGHVYACLPCADAGSIGERVARLVEGGVERSATGESRLFFEDPGHLRSIDSAGLARLFEAGGLELSHASFTGRWAEIEYFSRRGYRVRALFDPARAATRRGQAALAAGRAALLALGAVTRLGSAPSVERDAGRLKGAIRFALRPVAGPLARLVLDVAPRAEWKRHREGRGGAGQYLVFRKPPR